MNIIQIFSSKLGGSGKVGFDLTTALVHAGHNVHPVVIGDPHWSSQSFEYSIVYGENHPLFDSVIYEMPLIEKIIDLVLLYDIEVLHVHYAIPFAGAAVQALNILDQEYGRKLQLVTTFHGTDVIGWGKKFPLQLRYLGKKGKITAVSNDLKKELVKITGSDHIEVIPNFLHELAFREAKDAVLMEHFGFSSGDFVLGHISNHRTIKRLDLLFEVYEKIRDKFPHVKLLIAGDGPVTNKYKLLYQSDSRIKWGGVMTSSDFNALVDVNLITSEYESFSLAILESMSHGVVSVGFSVGGIPDLLSSFGLCFPFGNTTLMASALQDYLSLSNEEQYALRKQFFELAHHYSVKEILPHYLSLYS